MQKRNTKQSERMRVPLPSDIESIFRLEDIFAVEVEESPPEETTLRLRVANYRPDAELLTPTMQEVAQFLKLIRIMVFDAFIKLELGKNAPCQSFCLQEPDNFEVSLIIPSSRHSEEVTNRIDKVVELLTDVTEVFMGEFNLIALNQELYGKDWLTKLIRGEGTQIVWLDFFQPQLIIDPRVR